MTQIYGIFQILVKYDVISSLIYDWFVQILIYGHFCNVLVYGGIRCFQNLRQMLCKYRTRQYYLKLMTGLKKLKMYDNGDMSENIYKIKMI